jgi:hypothetical protein
LFKTSDKVLKATKEKQSSYRGMKINITPEFSTKKCKSGDNRTKIFKMLNEKKFYIQ